MTKGFTFFISCRVRYFNTNALCGCTLLLITKHLEHKNKQQKNICYQGEHLPKPIKHQFEAFVVFALFLYVPPLLVLKNNDISIMRRLKIKSNCFHKIKKKKFNKNFLPRFILKKNTLVKRIRVLKCVAIFDPKYENELNNFDLVTAVAIVYFVCLVLPVFLLQFVLAVPFVFFVFALLFCVNLLVFFVAPLEPVVLYGLVAVVIGLFFLINLRN